MIIEAKYMGPYPEVQAPRNSASRSIKRGEVVTLTVQPGEILSPCWEIVKGKDEYEAALKAAADAAGEVRDKMSKRAAATAAQAEKAVAAARGVNESGQEG